MSSEGTGRSGGCGWGIYGESPIRKTAAGKPPLGLESEKPLVLPHMANPPSMLMMGSAKGGSSRGGKSHGSRPPCSRW